MHNNYVQEGDCALGTRAAEIFQPTNALGHCELGVLICSFGFHGCMDR